MKYIYHSSKVKSFCMIPDFQSIMLPILEILSDGNEHGLQEFKEKISIRYNMTEEEKNALLPKVNQTIITNRISWARIYLKKAGLIDSPSRGISKISEKGREILRSKPATINIAFLKKLPGFQDWLNTSRSGKAKSNVFENEETIDEKTPEELLDYSFSQLKEELTRELSEKIRLCSPSFFENLVVDLLLKMGYGGSKQEAGQVLGKRGDGGIDGIIKEDRLGLDAIYIQAKRWENIVPVSAVRDFAGSLLSKKARKGIFITTSGYPKSAYEFVQSIDRTVVLIDGLQLAEFMIENNVGVFVKNIYEVKKIDSDYFDEI